ncbi:RDD family protein [Streptomyces sp. NPDC093094]|uniref:RDD family protein n=1 Tax=Streptomyces sp. NPDC093094 TaxID=3366026 RepID=UPI0037F6BE75
MSAPTPAPGDDRPREGYYPDPSIPGYVRYWNGSAWVPGTSRPAPSDGAPLSPPQGAAPPASAAPPVEETGPHFFDEDPEPGRSAAGARQEPASAWAADRARQSGFGGEQDRRISWGADPRVPADPPSADSGGAFGLRRPAVTGSGADQPGENAPQAGGPHFADGAPAQASGAGAASGPAADEGTMTFRAVPPRAADGPGFGAGLAAAERAAAQGVQGSAGAAGGHAAQAAAPAPAAPAASPASAGPAGSRPTAPGVPAQSGGAQQAAATAPVTSAVGGGQSSWAQQVHRLAGGSADEQPVAPWKPPVEDVFQAAARRQAEARPAGLGRRLAARLIDTVVVAGVTAAAAVPLATRALDHIRGKIDEARLSGETVTVWLLDGTTSAYLGIVLAVLLLTGVLYEALPTAKWGRTPGKKALGLEVRDIEAHEPPSFGAALRRWLVYSVPALLLFGVLGVLWCVFDRPWRQCWHDKAAHTFVAG